MPIGDYCQKPAATVRSDETVRVAAQRMQREGLGSLAVVQDGRPIGIVTDRDLALDTLCSRLDAGAVTVGELASRPLVAIDQDAPVREAVRRIRQEGVRRLPVVDDKGELVGILAADDLITLAAAEMSAMAVAIRAQCAGTEAPRRES